jgi:Zn-dependent peptidase ImmA (M78 family)
MTNGLSGVRADQTFSYRALERAADRVREYLRFPVDRAIDTLRLFEDLHEISIRLRDGTVIPFRGGVVALEDSEGYTRYDRQRRTIEILASEETYYRLEKAHPRAGYFVAHELGHCLLHTDQLVRLAQMPSHQQAAFHRGRAGHKPYEDTEWQANGFASALLMPARGIHLLEQAHKNLTPALVAARFRVSLEAAGYRTQLYQNRRNELLS